MSAPSPTERPQVLLVTLITLAALLTGCASVVSSPAPPHPGIGTAEIGVGGTELSVWVADSSEERRQGLRNVGVLPDGIHGMLFVWDSPAEPAFGMRDTLIPLDLWWFDPEGSLIGKTQMPTCPDGDCVSYGSPGPVRWALETPAGVFSFAQGSLLTTSANE